MPLGHNKLNSMVKCMMSKAGVKGYFTNHSLRATIISRLFQEGVDEKLIRGVTGHTVDQNL
jgi:site-specific recombinase XerD